MRLAHSVATACGALSFAGAPPMRALLEKTSDFQHRTSFLHEACNHFRVSPRCACESGCTTHVSLGMGVSMQIGTRFTHTDIACTPRRAANWRQPQQAVAAAAARPYGGAWRWAAGAALAPPEKRAAMVYE